MSQPINEASRRVIELAYDGSAESMFVKWLGKVLVDEPQNPDEEALASRILLRLTGPVSQPGASPEEQVRLQTMQGLLLAAVEARRFPERYENLLTKQ